MCGICGFTIPSDRSNPSVVLERMCRNIVHRGPDEQGTHITNRVALGMRRLSIIDVEGGTQPIFNEDRSICVLQNGEIYNFQELRRQLRALGHLFATQSDTEVIVHLYEEYGLNFVDHLNGMFAIALWDSRRDRLVLVRDRLGVKPLYYTLSGDSILFGSEIKCLLESDLVERELDSQAVYDYFTLGYIPQPRSIYASIRKLPPAGRLVFEKGRATIDRYWEIPTHIDHSLTVESATEQLRERLSDAVRLRMISDVPLGAFLSGGLDSSITVALMAELSERPVKTFFIDFNEDGYSEREYARAVAQHYGTEHHEFVVKPSALDILDDVVHHFDEPFGDSSAIPTYYVSQLTRQHVTVALAGDGGDESFGGYRRYREILCRRNLSAVRSWIRPLTDRIPSYLPRRFPGREFVRSLGLSNATYFATGTSEHLTRNLLSRDFLLSVRKNMREELDGSYPSNGSSGDPLVPYSRFDLNWYLPDDILTKVDRMSMAHSLEVRAPFLDYRVVELAASMPADWKIRGTESKWILKKSFAAKLPPSVLKQRKRGFSIPLAEWFRGELRPALDDVLHDQALADSGILNMKEVAGLIDEHISGARNRKSQLWRILFFARWWRAHRGAVHQHQAEKVSLKPAAV